MENFIPQKKYIKIKTIDAHTAGEPFRIITSGIPAVVGDTILEKRKYAKKHLDHIRKILMFEPRGHADMYGCIITEPVTKDADFGIGELKGMGLALKGVMGSNCSENQHVFSEIEGKAIFHGDRSFPSVFSTLYSFYP